MSFKARCMKEKKDVVIKNHKFVIMKNCGVAVSGECPHCGTNVRQIIAVNKAPADIQAKVADCRKKRASEGKKSKGKSGGKSAGKAKSQGKGKKSHGKK